MSEKLRLQEPIRSPLETPRLITPLPYRSGTSFLAWATVNNNQPVSDLFSKMTKIAASGRLGLVVVLYPGSDHDAGMIKAQEQGLVEQLVPHATVEALDVAILHWFARGNVVPLHADLPAPGEDGV
jgi:hypothetical protein